MIRGLYTHLDEHLKELEDKFKKDEMELRHKIDVEIKSQMSAKLKALDYKQTENYKQTFLYDISQSTLYRDLNITSNDGYYQGQTDIKYNLVEISNSLLTNCRTYYYFFNNLHLLNDDILLQKDEYIIGFIGHVNVNHGINQHHCSYQSNYDIMLNQQNLKFITNYFNYYDIIEQYNFQIPNKIFNERYQLKRNIQNDMKLFDEQIDIVISSFTKLQIHITITNHNSRNSANNIINKYILYTLYDTDVINIVHNFNKKLQYDKEIKEINYPSLKQECIEEDTTSDSTDYILRLKCCKKCHDKQKTILTRNRPSSIPVKNILNKTIDLNHSETLFHIFEKSFNDFWSDKIQEISRKSKVDISMAQLIEHKDKLNEDLTTENKTLKLKIKELDQKLTRNISCKEYEEQLKSQIKTQKEDIDRLGIELIDIKRSKMELSKTYQQLKSKINSLMN